jgi:hypothetical protein
MNVTPKLITQIGCAGLKIRPRQSHQNARTRNAFDMLGLSDFVSAPSRTNVQRNEQDPALNPALNFGVGRFPVGPAANR